MRRAIHLLGFSILTPLFILSTTRAQNPMDNPLLKSALAQQKVIIQKVAGEMRTALNDASRLQPTSKARAINALKAAMSKLEDPLIPQSFRQEWTANLNGAIARIEKGQSADLPAPAVNPVNREMKAAERARVKAILEEREYVHKSFGKIQALAKGSARSRARRSQRAHQEISKQSSDVGPGRVHILQSTTCRCQGSDWPAATRISPRHEKCRQICDYAQGRY